MVDSFSLSPQLVSGGEHKTKKILLKGTQHPSVERALKIVKEFFEQLCLIDQDILGSKESWSKVLSLIPDDDLRADCNKIMEAGKNGIDRWNKMKARIETYVKHEKPDNRKRKSTENLVEEIILQYTYPR